jgi:hypothetical protein
MEIRRARKDTQCTEWSYHTIKKGEPYLYACMPPWHEMNQSGKYSVIKACLRCAKEYNMHTKETREKVCCCSRERGEDHHPQCLARQSF